MLAYVKFTSALHSLERLPKRPSITRSHSEFYSMGISICKIDIILSIPQLLVVVCGKTQNPIWATLYSAFVYFLHNCDCLHPLTILISSELVPLEGTGFIPFFDAKSLAILL